jgi:predicted MPP superfamily phosphohydrolase
LRDECATLDLGQGRQLTLLGLDCSHDAERDARRLAAVAAQAPPDVFRVLLYHSPELISIAPKFDINLYLCGHTHGGQVRLPLYGAVLTSSRLGKRFEMGYYRLEDTHLYVSRGVGLEGMSAPRVRFLCPPEITLFSLDGRGSVQDFRP